MRQFGEQRREGLGIEIVHEMQARAIAQAVDAGHRVTGELGQRLAAQAGAAGAENDDVGCVLRQPLGGVADRLQIVMGLRQLEQRQAAVGMARAQGFQRAVGTRERCVQRFVGNALRPDVLFERAVDGLCDRHRRFTAPAARIPALFA